MSRYLVSDGTTSFHREVPTLEAALRMIARRSSRDIDAAGILDQETGEDHGSITPREAQRRLDALERPDVAAARAHEERQHRGAPGGSRGGYRYTDRPFVRAAGDGRRGTGHTHPPGRTRCPKCGV